MFPSRRSSEVIRLIVAVAVAAALALTATPALAINDMLVPGDECSASSQAVGHPAAGRAPFPPPFSANNPGSSEGAQASDHEQGTDHCPNG
jgi:hypothetical protein